MTQVRITVIIAILVGSFLGGNPIYGDDPLAEVKACISALRENIKSDRGPSDSSRSLLRRSTPELITELAACGEPAIPAIVSAIKQETSPYIVNSFADALAQIPGEQSWKALVSLKHSDLKYCSGIDNALVQHAKIAISAGSKLSADEINILEAILDADNSFAYSRAAEILSIYKNYDVAPVIKKLVKRLIHQIENPIPTPRHTMSYLPNQIGELESLCYGIGYFGERAFPVLKAEKKVNNNPEVQKWLNLTLGCCGDREVGSILADIVKDKTDRYVCFVAIRIYGRCMKKEAIPLLETFKEDETVTEYGGVPLKILSCKARETIDAINSGEM